MTQSEPADGAPKRFQWRSRADLAKLAVLSSASAVGGILALYFRLPLPFMLGGLLTTMTIAAFANRRGIGLPFPTPLRRFFVGLIGAMIGGTFTADLAGVVPELAVTLAGVVLYVGLAHWAGYILCRQIGRYDRATAFYASMPGGLIEAIELGDRAGGDMRVLTLSHFLRVCLIVVSVPLIFQALSGDPVGSAAGQNFERGESGSADVLVIAAITLAGLGIGRLLRFPARHLLGPMLVSAALHGTGLIQTSSPAWLLYAAQLIVGVGLGTQFSGASGPIFRRVLKTTVLMVVAMLGLSAAFAFGLSAISETGREALFLSLAPGGVSETGLIALSLGLSPVIVTAHHVFRIFLTVSVAAISTRFFRKN